MIVCQNCGKTNSNESQFCRFCGRRIEQSQALGYENLPPRPYSWQTDEYQTQAEARAKFPAQNKLPQQNWPQGPMTQNPANVDSHPVQWGGYVPAAGYRCPFCGTTNFPIIERRISTAGWIIFALLLVFTFIFFWIGLLIKEEVQICPVCRREIATGLPYR